jgi:N-acetylneuraminic acid mutarotase
MMENKRALLIVLLILCSLLVAFPIIEIVMAAEDSWTTMEPMPTDRAWLGVAVVEGKIYAIVDGINYEYDPVTDTWTTKTPMPTPRSSFGIAVVDNKIYIMGGAVSPTTLNQVYDPETDTWSSGAPLPTGVDSAAAGVTAGDTATERIFVLGGKQGLDAVNLNQVYDPETDTWVDGTAMPTARYGLGVAVVDDSLYAIGGREGWVGFPVSAANERYTPADFIPEFPSWTPLPVMLSIVLVVAVIYRRKLQIRGLRK